MKALPTLFLSHGSPMHAISPGDVGDAWAALGQRLPRPDAILMCSAHWETSLPMVTGQRKPQRSNCALPSPECISRRSTAPP